MIIDQYVNKFKDDAKAMVLLERLLFACVDYVNQASMAEVDKIMDAIPPGAGDMEKAQRALYEAYREMEPYGIKLAHGKSLEDSAGLIVYDIFRNRRR